MIWFTNQHVIMLVYLKIDLLFNDWVNKTIGDEGITVDFRFIKVHTSN